VERSATLGNIGDNFLSNKTTTLPTTHKKNKEKQNFKNLCKDDVIVFKISVNMMTSSCQISVNKQTCCVFRRPNSANLASYVGDHVCPWSSSRPEWCQRKTVLVSAWVWFLLLLLCCFFFALLINIYQILPFQHLGMPENHTLLRCRRSSPNE